MGVTKAIGRSRIRVKDHSLVVSDEDRIWRNLEQIIQCGASELGGWVQIANRQTGLMEFIPLQSSRNFSAQGEASLCFDGFGIELRLRNIALHCLGQLRVHLIGDRHNIQEKYARRRVLHMQL